MILVQINVHTAGSDYSKRVEFHYCVNSSRLSLNSANKKIRNMTLPSNKMSFFDILFMQLGSQNI